MPGTPSFTPARGPRLLFCSSRLSGDYSRLSQSACDNALITALITARGRYADATRSFALPPCGRQRSNPARLQRVRDRVEATARLAANFTADGFLQVPPLISRDSPHAGKLECWKSPRVSFQDRSAFRRPSRQLALGIAANQFAACLPACLLATLSSPRIDPDLDGKCDRFFAHDRHTLSSLT
jgi:hypothetical protein